MQPLTPTQEASLRFFATGTATHRTGNKPNETTYRRLRQLDLIAQTDEFPYHVATAHGYLWLAQRDGADTEAGRAWLKARSQRLHPPFTAQAWDYETSMFRDLRTFDLVDDAITWVDEDFADLVQTALAIDPTFTIGHTQITNQRGVVVWGDEWDYDEGDPASGPAAPRHADENPLASEATPMVKLTLKGRDSRPTPQEKTMTTIANRNTKALKPCACSLFQVEKRTDIADGDLVRTGCTRQTNRQFAQGHDAKLVSFLVEADIEGRLIMVDGLAENFASAEEALRATFGESLAAKAQKAVVNALDRAARSRKPKAEPKAPKQVGVKVTVVEPDSATRAADPATEIQGKVGRWQYTGTELTDGAFLYRTQGGEVKRAEPGKWTKVA